MPAIFQAVLRFIALLYVPLLVPAIVAQTLANDSTAALLVSRSVSVPLNNLKLFDSALEAWTWTFGQEPGAKLVRSDREQGILEGTARLNFRSQMLTNREETMGVIQYKVIINVRSGECRTMVTEFTHSGNSNGPRNGIHLGMLTRRIIPPVRTPGMGRNNAIRLYKELKDISTLRANTLLAAFEARLRSGMDER
jgi:hypothetical protein